MTISRPDIYEDFRSHFNEPVLFAFEVARLIGYGETAVDCYLIAQHPGGRVVWHTAVGGYVFLSALDQRDRGCVDSWLELNGAPMQAEMRIDLRPDEHEGFPLPPQG